METKSPRACGEIEKVSNELSYVGGTVTAEVHRTSKLILCLYASIFFIVGSPGATSSYSGIHESAKGHCTRSSLQNDYTEHFSSSVLAPGL